MEEFLQVGVITATHGIHGEVKVFPTTDDPKRFKKLKKVLLDTGREKLELEVEGVKFFKNMVILKFKEYNDIIIVLPIPFCFGIVIIIHYIKIKRKSFCFFLTFIFFFCIYSNFCIIFRYFYYNE